jgi:hypothetical protein
LGAAAILKSLHRSSATKEKTMNALALLMSFTFFVPMALAIGGQLLADETGDAVPFS